MNKPKTNNFNPAWIILLMSVVLLSIGVTTIVKVFRAKSWIIVQGVIADSYINEHERTKKSNNKSYLVTEYTPQINFDYTVEEKQYRNDRVFWGTRSNSQKSALKQIKKYPVGKPVMVHYNPNNPADSVLEIRFRFKTFVAFLIGLMFFAFSIFMFIKKDDSEPKSKSKNSNKFGFMKEESQN